MKIGRDSLVVVAGLALAAFEITVGGARPAVLTFLSGLLLSPLVIRVDELRRRNGGHA